MLDASKQLLAAAIGHGDAVVLQQEGVRLLGFGVSQLKLPGLIQGTLFDQQERAKFRKVDGATDQIKTRFGDSAIRRGSSISHQIRHRPDPRVDE